MTGGAKPELTPKALDSNLTPKTNPIDELALSGIPRSHGISMGLALVLTQHDLEINYERRKIGPNEVDSEIKRLDDAIARIVKQFEEDRAAGPSSADIDIAKRIGIYTHPKRLNTMKSRISEQCITAPQAVDEVLGAIAQDFCDDDHIRNEINGTRLRMISELDGSEIGAITKLREADKRFVLFANCVLPDWIKAGMQGNKRMMHGICTVTTEMSSHGTDEAAYFKIPMVSGAFIHENDMIRQVQDGDPVIVDGNQGMVYIRPSKANLEKYRPFIKRRSSVAEEKVELEEPWLLTKDGIKIFPYVAGSSVAELEEGISMGAPGIGLPRTELMYCNSFERAEDIVLPFFRVKEMIEDYSRINKALFNAEGQCQWRTFDWSYDKQKDLMSSLISKLPEEERGGRSRSELFVDYVYAPQIRALLIAGQHHDSLRIYFPFIGSGLDFADRIALVQAQIAVLRNDPSRPKYNRNPTLGAMIETFQGARNLNFIVEHKPSHICIGSNDALASIVGGDRQRRRDRGYAEPALLEMVEGIVQTVDKVNEEIEVSVCGNLANPAYLPLNYAMGIRRIAVRPKDFHELIKIAPILEQQECQELLTEAKQHQTAAGVDAVLKSFYTRKGLDQTFW